MQVSAWLDKGLKARRSNGELWSEVILLGVVVLVVLFVAFAPVSQLAGSIAASLLEVTRYW